MSYLNRFFIINTPLVTLFETPPDLPADQGTFADLVEQAQNLAHKLAAMRTLVDTHRVAYWGVLRPLQNRKSGLKRAITMMLDKRLSEGGLSAKQQRMVQRIICRTAKEFALQGDADMRALHDKYSEETLTEIEKAQAAEAQAYFERMMGESLDEEDEFDNIDDVLHASIERMRKQAEAKAKAKERRQKRKNKKSDQNAPEFDQGDIDIQASLRTLYRQLASVLHPDRESDPETKKRKTDLMSQANTAYGRGDLFSLLQLQIKADMTQNQIAATLARNNIYALTGLIEQRISALQQEIRDLEFETVAEFVLPSAVSITESALKSHLTKKQRDLQSDIIGLKEDMTEIESNAGLKRWLKHQDEDI